MTSPLDEFRKKNLLEQIEQKLKGINALHNQLLTTLNVEDKVKIEKKYKDAGDELADLYEEMDFDESPNIDWEVHLPKIDYKAARAIINNVLDKVTLGGGALFLLQESQIMGGEWCVNQIKLLLSNKKLRHFQVEFLQHQRLNEFELMYQIGAYLNVEDPTDNLEQYTHAVIHKICNSLEIGTTIFVELRLWDDLSLQDHFLQWFILEFWKPLLGHLPELTERLRRIRFIVAIVANNKLSSTCLRPHLLCSPQQFDQEKIVVLPLEYWTEEEIKEWLYEYSSVLSAGEDFDQTARVIFQSSKGIPLVVYNNLIKHFHNSRK